MDRFESPRPETGEASAPSRLVRLMPSQLTSYDAEAVGVKQPTRDRVPNVALWPGWTKLPVEQLDLDGFDDHGNPLFPEGGY